MDPLDELGSLQKKKRGQTLCQNCKKPYNNRSIKVKCDNCDAFMGGSYLPKEREKDALLITSTIASVRLNAAGVAVRVFVDLKENKVIMVGPPEPRELKIRQKQFYEQMTKKPAIANRT